MIWIGLLGGVALLFVGGEALVRGAGRLALTVGLSPMAVGLTVVAFGTSVPELIVSVQSALGGAPDIAVGNIVGSNIANIGLILGVAAVVCPVVVASNVLRVDGPLMFIVSLVLVAIMIDGTIGRADGSVLVLGLVAYVAFTVRVSRTEPEAVVQEFQSAAPNRLPNRSMAPFVNLALVTGGVLALVLGGKLFVGGAVRGAAALGVSEAMIGLTVVAVGTSLPELTTSILAAIRGAGDIAVGNVIGSNIFNILGIGGATALIHPLTPGDIAASDLAVLVGFAVILLWMMRTARSVSRLEGLLLIGLYGLYVVSLLAT